MSKIEAKRGDILGVLGSREFWDMNSPLLFDCHWSLLDLLWGGNHVGCLYVVSV